jgi:hypothetical protein
LRPLSPHGATLLDAAAARAADGCTMTTTLTPPHAAVTTHRG